MDSFLESLKNLGAGRLIMMLVTFFGLMIFFVFIALRSSAPSVSLLYADLNTSDATEIAAKLDNSKIPYTLSDDGTKVSVPHKDISRARMLLAAEGLPHKGNMGYEIFDQKQSFGTTSFQQNINALRALEGELSRTIGTIDQIRAARVHLVLPQRELFSRERQPASASVFLNLRSANGLGNEQVAAIQHLVAAAVPQLKPGAVAIIDQNGNLLARGEEGDDAKNAARSGNELRTTYETRLTRQIEDMVGRIVGYGKVRTTVSADMNFDTLSRNSETYNPDGQVVRSTQNVTEESSEAAPQDTGVSVANNLPGLNTAGAGGGTASNKNSRTEETTNYEIPKTVESLVRASGTIEKLSVAVLVDGSYVPDTAAAKPKDAKDDWQPPKKYVPRSAEELQKLTDLVKSAVGFDENRGDKVEVVNMQFAENDMFDTTPLPDDNIMGFPKSDLLSVAQTVALSIVAILIVLLVLRPLVMHFSAGAQRQPGRVGDGSPDTPLLGAGQQPAQLAGPGGNAGNMLAGPTELDSMIDMSAVEGKVKASSVQKISDLVTNHPNETVSVIRQWMTTEN